MWGIGDLFQDTVDFITYLVIAVIVLLLLVVASVGYIAYSHFHQKTEIRYISTQGQKPVSIPKN